MLKVTERKFIALGISGKVEVLPGGSVEELRRGLARNWWLRVTSFSTSKLRQRRILNF